MQAIEALQVVQPPCASEPDPVKRFFQDLRRAPEDRMDPTLAAIRRLWDKPCRPGRQIRRGCDNFAVGTGSERP